MDDLTDRFSQFVGLCLQSAERARGWRRALDDGYRDPDTLAREQDKLFRDGAGQRKKALLHIQEDMSRFGQHWSLGIAEAQAVLAQQGLTIRIEQTSGRSTESAPDGAPDISTPTAALMLLLAATESCLQRGLFSQKQIYLHHVRRSALILPRPINSRAGRLNEVAMSLLFELVFIARVFTSGEERLVQAGEPMPDIGSPCWGLAAAFMNDTLGTSHLPNDITTLLTRFLRRNPGVGWGIWLDPPEKYRSRWPHDM